MQYCGAEHYRKNGLSTGARHLLVEDSPSNVTLLATTTANPNAILRFVDTGSASSATTVVTASTNTAFRGLALSPAP